MPDRSSPPFVIPQPLMSRANLCWLLVYLALMALVVGGVFRARDRVLTTLGTPEARADWQTWRRDVRGRVERGEGPVRRRVPPSAEPNLLVLLRDSFPMCLTAAVVFSSLLYLVLMLLLRGALRGGHAFGRENAFHKPEAQARKNR